MTRLALASCVLGTLGALLGCDADTPSTLPLDGHDSGEAAGCLAPQPYQFGVWCCQTPEGELCSPLPELACRGTWLPGPVPEPWWIAAPPSACVSDPMHEPPQAYDTCHSGGTGLNSDVCGVPLAGALECGGQMWMPTCQSTPDCPMGMVCVWGDEIHDSPPPPELAAQRGECAKRCTGAGGEAECIRCDLVCDAAGYCRARGPDLTVGHACTADCECWDVVDPMYGETLCVGGRCQVSGAPRIGLCGDPEADCACRGGTCEPHPSGGCCRLPDGSIALPGSEACQR